MYQKNDSKDYKVGKYFENHDTRFIIGSEKVVIKKNLYSFSLSRSYLIYSINEFIHCFILAKVNHDFYVTKSKGFLSISRHRLCLSFETCSSCGFCNIIFLVSFLLYVSGYLFTSSPTTCPVNNIWSPQDSTPDTSLFLLEGLSVGYCIHIHSFNVYPFADDAQISGNRFCNRLYIDIYIADFI